VGGGQGRPVAAACTAEQQWAELGAGGGQQPNSSPGQQPRPTAPASSPSSSPGQQPRPAARPAAHHAVLEHRGQVAALCDGRQVRRQLLQVQLHPVLHPAVQHRAVPQAADAAAVGGCGGASAGRCCRRGRVLWQAARRRGGTLSGAPAAACHPAGSSGSRPSLRPSLPAEAAPLGPPPRQQPQLPTLATGDVSKKMALYCMTTSKRCRRYRSVRCLMYS
jgi:hypothetical protein